MGLSLVRTVLCYRWPPVTTRPHATGKNTGVTPELGLWRLTARHSGVSVAEGCYKGSCLRGAEEEGEGYGLAEPLGPNTL